jgi:hypothetical protein
MDDRKSRINKLSERFKVRPGRPKQSAKERERRSYYLDTEIADRLDKDYKEFNHQAYPHTVSKSVFIETLLEYSLNNLPSIQELITTKAEKEPMDE